MHRHRRWSSAWPVGTGGVEPCRRDSRLPCRLPWFLSWRLDPFLHKGRIRCHLECRDGVCIMLLCNFLSLSLILDSLDVNSSSDDGSDQPNCHDRSDGWKLLIFIQLFLSFSLFSCGFFCNSANFPRRITSRKSHLCVVFECSASGLEEGDPKTAREWAETRAKFERTKREGAFSNEISNSPALTRHFWSREKREEKWSLNGPFKNTENGMRASKVNKRKTIWRCAQFNYFDFICFFCQQEFHLPYFGVHRLTIKLI